VPEQYPLETLRNLHRSLLLAALEAQEWSRILIRRAGHQQMLAACISDAVTPNSGNPGCLRRTGS